MKFPLIQGAYQARSVIAAAQSCINLFPEPNPSDSPFPMTHYPASGTSLYADLSGSASGPVRGLYWATSTDALYAVVGTTVLKVNGPGDIQVLGTLAANTGNPVRMSDNGLVAVIVDGSAAGYTINLTTQAFAPIIDAGKALTAVRVASIQEEAGTYNAAAQTFTFTASGAVSLAGVTVNAGDRVLLTAQTDATQNGPYVVTATGNGGPGVLTRTADTLASGTNMVETTSGATYKLTTADPITVGTTALTFAVMPWYGANNVDFIDTFLVFNKPGTPTFYVSPSNWNGTDAFDPLYYAEKIGYSDTLVTLAALHDTIWLLGEVTTEVWFNSGAPDFPFQRMPNSIIQMGCIAPYSVAIAANALFWLSRDRYGQNVLMRGQGYQAQRVSNFAVEHEWAKYYAKDCTAMVYQQAGHEILVLYFPADNATWAFDVTTLQWHRRSFADRSSAWLPYCMAYRYDTNTMLAGDRTAARLLEINRFTYTDLGTPIPRVRAWPHLQNDEKRMAHTDFSASMVPTNLVPDAVTLRWSDDGGQTWGNPVVQAAGGAGWPESYGQYSWSRLGYARSRVYELSWTSTGETALNGAWVQAEPAET